MNTLGAITDLRLTGGQETALDLIERFIASDKDVFILKGYAGTGKTTLIKKLIENLRENKRSFEVFAPTGRAAKILRDKTGTGSTIHSGIYNLLEFKTINDDSEDQAEKSFHYLFPVRDNDEINRVCIIDESSMISDVESHNEFFTFGTNRLLYDILTYMKMPGSGNKLIFVGDPAQLPPVNDAKSKALDPEYFKEKDLSLEEYELSEVVRQKAESGILLNAARYRRVLNSEERNSLSIKYHKDVLKLELENVVKTYLTEFPKPKVGNGVIINFSNKQCLSFNQMIREKIFPNKEEITAGDIILINNNNYHTYPVELLNGDMAEVTWVSPTKASQSAPVYVKQGGEKKRKVITLNFRDIKIKVPEYDGEISCKIIDSLLNNPFRDLSEDEFRSLYINFNIRFNEDQRERSSKGLERIEPGSEKFKELVRNDPYYNALRVKYGYAITCHKSQGGEWNTAFVNFDGRVGLKDAHLRWGYTAITRAVDKLYIINAPSISEFSKISFSSISRMGKLPKNAIQYNTVPETIFHHKESHPAKKLKYFEILEKIEETPFTLNRVETRDFQEMYFINYDEDVIRIDSYHDSAGLFQDFQSQSSHNKVAVLLECVNSKYNQDINLNYSPSTDFLSKLYSKIRMYCNELEIMITNVDEQIGSYYVVYYFQIAHKQYGSIQFYFKKNGQFSNGLPKLQEGTSNDKFQSLINKLS